MAILETNTTKHFYSSIQAENSHVNVMDFQSTGGKTKMFTLTTFILQQIWNHQMDGLQVLLIKEQV